MGRADVILDNLIAEKKPVPMIVVMPDNTIPAKAAHSNLGSASMFDQELQTEIMPLIQKHYRVLSDRVHRAMAGLSFGGGTTFTIGMRHLDEFAYLGEFGSALFGGLLNSQTVTSYGPYDPEKIAPGIYRNLISPDTRLRLFYMSCGAEDPGCHIKRRPTRTFGSTASNRYS